MLPAKTYRKARFRSWVAGWWLLLLVGSLVSCGSKDDETTLFTLVENSGINFRNDVKDSREDNSFLFRNFYNGGGVAIGDINNDSLPDVMLTSNQGENKLYLNRGGFRFDDISTRAGLQQDGLWNTGVTFVDINADGWLDIYVCSSGHMKNAKRKNKLYINRGPSPSPSGEGRREVTFTEEAAKYGLDISGYCTQASFFDYDGDGDLDMFLINNSPIPFSSLNYANMRDLDIAKWQVDEDLKGGGNHLFKNEDGHFAEVTKEAGLHTGLISFGLGVSVGDMNNDGWPDVYVGNDFIEKDYLYINQKNGTFKDSLEACMQQISMSSMSTDLGDVNNDGLPDLFTTDMIPDDDYRLKTTGTFDNIDLYLSKQKAGLYHQYVRNCLQVANGNGTFSEVANFSGVQGTDWSWGAVFLDADNDGRNDLFICNGIAKDVGDLDFLDFFSNEVYTKMMTTGQRADMDELLKHIPVTPIPNRVFHNRGNLRFEDAGKEWGFTQASFSNSVAYGDLDNDGDLDLVVNNENSPAFVYRNNSRQKNGYHFVALQLKGKEGNPFAIGATIKAYKDGQVFYRDVSPVRGFQSSMDYRQVIGLGKASVIDSLLITWPDRTVTKYRDLPVDQWHVLQQGEGDKTSSGASPSASALFQPVTASFDKHREDDYVDFYYERNLPQLLSREGPHVAKGDVNGDGLEDLYIGGAKDQPGQLYLQKGDGSFQKKEQALFRQYQDFEDVAVLFFDADKDRDLDLFIGAGGNNVSRGGKAIQHRLYSNDGKGNFSISPNAFPNNDANIAVAAANDFDDDGDPDLFVGGRSVPYAFGLMPRNYLYRNDGKGHFADVTATVCAPLQNIGMVTDAAWADLDGDGKNALLVTGEWMTTKIFMISGGKLVEQKETGLQHLSGWWQSLAVADLNGDGRQDLVLGNIGENFYLRPNKEHPVKLWVKDFDNNSMPDQFITQTIKGRDMPVFLKREITDQFPSLKKDNLKHSDYARKSIQDLFGNNVLADAGQYPFNFRSSVVAFNRGNSRFDVSPLPVRAQLSSINAICATDVNGDGQIDLVTGGNRFTFPPQFGRLDASYGDVLLNDGKGDFTWLPNTASGILVKGEVKDVKEIRSKKGRQLLFIQNNDLPVLYRLK